MSIVPTTTLTAATCKLITDKEAGETGRQVPTDPARVTRFGVLKL